ncbi:hypothetical protein CTRI78_v001187 [Colletotrichum trifolii]|uniref:Uncharacterized protein n=1 Tax=Colletotrichum trifolii TaxID=5466 RepID=A0A4R8RTG8_COLTR|nr:hypothetical protein CTRI78_v001187 [Colletotrichum trifolii]
MPLLKAEPGPKSDAAWRGLSMGHSLVEINKSEAQAMGIGDGLPTMNPVTELYGGMIRQGFWDALRQRYEFLDPVPSVANKSDAKARYLDHLQHFFDYLQQAIVCAGDVTLEGRAEETKEEATPHINGYGALHRCRDM